MEEFLNNNPSLKRLGVTVAGSAAIALNAKSPMTSASYCPMPNA